MKFVEQRTARIALTLWCAIATFSGLSEAAQFNPCERGLGAFLESSSEPKVLEGLAKVANQKESSRAELEQLFAIATRLANDAKIQLNLVSRDHMSLAQYAKAQLAAEYDLIASSIKAEALNPPTISLHLVSLAKLLVGLNGIPIESLRFARTGAHSAETLSAITLTGLHTWQATHELAHGFQILLVDKTLRELKGRGSFSGEPDVKTVMNLIYEATQRPGKNLVYLYGGKMEQAAIAFEKDMSLAGIFAATESSAKRKFSPTDYSLFIEQFRKNVEDLNKLIRVESSAGFTPYSEDDLIHFNRASKTLTFVGTTAGTVVLAAVLYGSYISVQAVASEP